MEDCHIRPIPKVPAPSGHADFRPISVTPVLTRVMEKIVRQFLYPSFITTPPTLTFSDQFAFRPTGSPVAALIYILHTVTQLLTTQQYVIVVALDFSKACDSVRHATLFSKMADLDIPDNVYNWLVSYFSGHSMRYVSSDHTACKRNPSIQSTGRLSSQSSRTHQAHGGAVTYNGGLDPLVANDFNFI